MNICNTNNSISKNTRIYPLRTSSNIWKIKLYSKHICNEDCKLAYIEEPLSRDSSLMFIIDNPNYNYENNKCSYSMTLNPSIIHLISYNIYQPMTIDGELLFENNIVIPDTKIYINITFPIKDPKKIMVNSDDPLGFSLSNIIKVIKDVYKWIYQEEENTCSINKYNIINQCECMFQSKTEKLINSFKTYQNQKENEKCPICLEIYEKDKDILIETICNHSFHENCIKEWVSNQKETCPLCRKSMYNCEKCINKGYTVKEYTGKIIPKNIRGISSSRNITDGIFGIYDFDIEDLYLEYMTYNNVDKILYPKISY